ncbi:hypothetical protein LTR95_011300 [Oleoguttula sp. CCFEE 5521]
MADSMVPGQNTDSTDDPTRRSKRVVIQKPFRFFDLIPEIRNIIYKLALLHDQPIFFNHADNQRQPNLIQLRGLTQASCACRQESLLTFWSINCFWMFTGHPAWRVISDDDVRGTVIASMRHLQIYQPECCHKDDPQWSYIKLDLDADPRSCINLVKETDNDPVLLEDIPTGTMPALSSIAAALLWPGGQLEVSAEALTGMAAVLGATRHGDLIALAQKSPDDIRLEFLNCERHRRARALEKQLGLGEYEVEDAQSYQAARRLEQHLGLARYEIEECETWDLVDWSDGEVSQWAARREAAFDEAVRVSEAWRNGTGRSEV